MAPLFAVNKQGRVKSPQSFVKWNYYKKSPSQSTSSYTSSGRSSVKSDTPGPGSYYLPHPDIYKLKSPSFSMRERIPFNNTNDTPGPGAYSPEKVWINKKSAPRYTFGIRHSPYVVSTHRLEATYINIHCVP
ncbi:ciliary microtubule associated protein 1A-like isoform X1 [Centruroides vittatus]|uniref:ciliary microtubule associated protein 1A-like isoform X1 n=1 Tax=Centruroides vittatus TaxID=120091 RepID=UPI0035105D04